MKNENQHETENSTAGSKSTILILGASSDIGIALIKRIYDKYDLIVAHYNKNSESLDNLSTELDEEKRKIIPEKADFSDESDTDAFVTRISEKYENITHVVHLPANRINYARFTRKEWTSVALDIDIQLRSIYKTVSRLITRMSQMKQGKIVIMLSSCTVRAPKQLADYTIAKYSLLGFVKAIAAEYTEKGININAISPSMIETGFLSNVPHLIVEENARSNPMKRNANVQDIVPMIDFLLSPASDFMSGQNIVISGGE